MWTSQVYGHHDKMARTKTHPLQFTSGNNGVQNLYSKENKY